MVGIRRYEEGIEAFLGQRFQDAMEWLYRIDRLMPASDGAFEIHDNKAESNLPEQAQSLKI